MDFGKVMTERENKTVYRNGDKTVKVFAENYSKAYVMNEVYNQAIIEELGMNVPEVLSINKENGRWVVVSQYLEGDTLDTIMEKNPEKEDEYLEMFVNLQIEVQSKETNFLTSLKDKLHQQIRTSEVPATVRYDFHRRLDSMPKHHKVCHGDFNPSNIIIANDGTAYILDWSHATQGNASGDAAMTYLLFRLSGKEEFAEKYLDLFCEKSVTEKEYVKKWIPMVAASHSIECKPEEKAMLEAWAEEYSV